MVGDLVDDFSQTLGHNHSHIEKEEIMKNVNTNSR